MSIASPWNTRALLFSLLLIVPSESTKMGIIRHDVDVERYREMGGRAEFSSVGRYSTIDAPDSYAAGVLVSPGWVLTAAHFPQEASVWMFGESFYKTKRIVRHPKLAPDAAEAQWNGWDLALVELESPVLNIAPAVRYHGRSEVGAVVTKVGYGYRGDGLNGMLSPPVAERLGGQNVIDAAGGIFESRTFGEDVLVFDFSPLSGNLNPFGSAEPLELEIGGSKGDSGGGVFMEVDGKWRLAGIVSGALNRQIKYGSCAALARVSSANTWIDSVIRESNE